MQKIIYWSFLVFFIIMFWSNGGRGCEGGKVTDLNNTAESLLTQSGIKFVSVSPDLKPFICADEKLATLSELQKVNASIKTQTGWWPPSYDVVKVREGFAEL